MGIDFVVMLPGCAKVFLLLLITDRPRRLLGNQENLLDGTLEIQTTPATTRNGNAYSLNSAPERTENACERARFFLNASQGGTRMHRESTTRHHTAAAIALAISLAVYPAITQADDSASREAAEATSGQMDGREATSGDPEDRTAESRGPDETTVDSETMHGRMAESANPTNMVTDGGRLNESAGSSTDLTDLKEARPKAGFEEIEVSGQAEWETTTDSQVLVARKHLLRAQERARNARTVYGDMMERNYPRGAARIQIVQERDASMKALEEAKSALADVES